MKQTLKQEVSQKREHLTKEQIKEKDLKIKNTLYSLNEFKKAKNIAFYVSVNHEVDTHNIIKELLTKKTIIVPYLVKNNPILQLSEIYNFNDLEPKSFGILEPKEYFIKQFDPKKIDMIIIPAIVFDLTGHRIGYGYGYYDRFLRTLDNVKKIGLAYKLQIVDKIPEEQHDIPVDVIITEDKIIDCKK